MADEKVVIEIDLSKVVVARGEDGQMFGDYVASLAADRLLERDVKGRWAENFRVRVGRIRDDEIVSAVRPLIEDAIAASVQPTDAFGEPKGEPTTLRDLILKKATAELRLRATGTRSGFSRDARSLLEEVVDDAVRRTLKAELETAVGEARAQVLAAVKEQAAEVIQETIRRTARV